MGMGRDLCDGSHAYCLVRRHTVSVTHFSLVQHTWQNRTPITCLGTVSVTLARCISYSKTTRCRALPTTGGISMEGDVGLLHTGGRSREREIPGREVDTATQTECGIEGENTE